MKQTRMTRQKKIILEVLRSTRSHPTADWIYMEARKQIPNLSLGTVYRNLNQLAEMGEILELNYGSSFSRFDGNPVPHYHLVCENCGRVYDLELPVMHQLETSAAAVSGAEIRGHRLEFYGICNHCKREQYQQ
ncbi:MAG: Fur family transcriptional regulator [Bacillota bacterium]|uniref:Ferric uptake regulator, Fur family n=2 Tax=Carboxydocella TaxID=178898 RepID=A0A1T4LC71_9FIRM|nr:MULTISPECIES: transcriptional repressor [Carboxydocella]AVX19855.1 Fur family transcriptional regulator [Carboxydocella thermautotrophica]AVX30264.1 Fur family transcriptional regulator [Carboxydocella thermautotrophica]SJZ52256.1 ferric uptake regulator, Fur family [Carboxydocella sporoproducens DSM 16521]GAW28680.1 transcriptional repressor [Carboxydocella sp. ULO1]GAW30525.1 transcriptional repressor [Carboxydocella sp. JDF658]